MELPSIARQVAIELLPTLRDAVAQGTSLPHALLSITSALQHGESLALLRFDPVAAARIEGGSDRVLVARAATGLLEASVVANGGALSSPGLPLKSAGDVLRAWLDTLLRARLGADEHAAHAAWSALPCVAASQAGGSAVCLDLDASAALSCALLAPMLRSGGMSFETPPPPSLLLLLRSPAFLLGVSSLLQASLVGGRSLHDDEGGSGVMPSALAALLARGGGADRTAFVTGSSSAPPSPYTKRFELRRDEPALLSRLGVVSQSAWWAWLGTAASRSSSERATFLAYLLSAKARLDGGVNADGNVNAGGEAPVVTVDKLGGLWRACAVRAADSAVMSSPLGAGAPHAARLAAAVLGTALASVGGCALLVAARDADLAGAGGDNCKVAAAAAAALAESSDIGSAEASAVLACLERHCAATAGAAAAAVITPQLARALYNPAMHASGSLPAAVMSPTAMLLRSPPPRVGGGFSTAPSVSLIVQSVALAAGLAAVAARSAVCAYLLRLPRAMAHALDELDETLVCAHRSGGGGELDLRVLPSMATAAIAGAIVGARALGEARIRGGSKALAASLTTVVPFVSDDAAVPVAAPMGESDHSRRASPVREVDGRAALVAEQLKRAGNSGSSANSSIPTLRIALNLMAGESSSSDEEEGRGEGGVGSRGKRRRRAEASPSLSPAPAATSSGRLFGLGGGEGSAAVSRIVSPSGKSLMDISTNEMEEEEDGVGGGNPFWP